ncbi:putative RNA methyltransferase [Cryptosporangium aurantiacum]|uniref:23S rRNA m(1)G-748 methyltransferase n=1 Tax=Cryptosporangium aurantiacum TaxID=134849 RepID=A0A1M7RIG4_9ACTN|nr:methyltransferase domain-containing protein [Cryptosporangium aurantiacum]SHN46057.1 23S rRNA m(1)G-748 methyltransferase [Cryptosporangium aurantiacum]
MLADVVDRLRCPHCAARTGDDVGLTLDGGTLRCPERHSFDVAKQGYVSLLTGAASAVPGDTAAMVAAREAFLAGGHFTALTAALAAATAAQAADPAAASPASPVGCVVDLGAGTGHHLAGVLDAVPGWVGVAADISGYALRRAARAHPRAGAIRCDSWRPLPLRTGAADVVLIVFAPRNGAELHRVLRPGGAALVAAPTDRHLRELATAVGAVSVDPRKSDRLDAALGPYLSLTEARTHETTLRLSHAEAVTAVAMGPAAWHVDAETLAARVAAVPEPVEVTVSVTLSTYRRTS